MIEWAYFHGKNPYRFIIDKRTAIDIDDGLDLAVAAGMAGYGRKHKSKCSVLGG